MSVMKPLGIAAAAAVLALPFAASADDVADFYHGKTVTLYIGYSVGGGYDTYARLVANYMGKHIPGNPTVVPENMPGAGSLRLTNWLYEAAPRDGTVFGAVARAVPFEPLLKNETATFDALKFSYIGNANVETSVCAVNASTGIGSIDDLRGEEIVVGGTGPASDPNQQTNIVNAALGTKMRIIDGYPGGNDIVMAMERGEVDGRCGWSWSTIKVTNLDWVKEGRVKLVVQLAKARDPELPDVPLASELAQTDEAKALVNFVVAPLQMGRPYIAPPEVPADRLAALRTAFDETMADPEFLAAARGAGLEIVPSTGADMEQVVAEVYQTDPATVEKIIAALN